MLVLNQSEVTKSLPLEVCIDAMRSALSAFARGEAVVPLRKFLHLPDGAGVLGTMPAFDGETGALGLKALVVLKTARAGRDSHQGAVLLFDVQTGSLHALVDATAITAIRTAAVSAVATDALARRDADDLAILGAGTQAATHLEAIRHVRTLRRVRVWSRSIDRARQFAKLASAKFACRVEPMESVREALEGASIVCTTTGAPTPIVERAWFAPGTHINAVGSSFATRRELDTRTVVESSVFVDSRESALNEAGDFLIPLAEGALRPDHIRAELGEVLIGRHPGRASPDELTLFKSLGLGLEDVVAAQVAVARAQERQLGLSCPFGGVAQSQLMFASESRGADGDRLRTE